MGMLVSSATNPCQCGASSHCLEISGIGSAHNGDGCVSPPDYWGQTSQSQRALINPASCGITMSLLSRGTAGGFFPGFTITELYARGLSYFHWNYTVTLDGVVTLISILNAFVNVGGSFNCDIVFNNPGWHQVGGGNWQWDYSGPISSNPVVIQTFWLDQTRCLYAPYFPYADFWST